MTGEKKGRYAHPTQRSPRRDKMYIFNGNKKKIDFLCSKNFKFLSQLQGNSINDESLFFNFIIFVRVGHCDHSPRVIKT